MVFDFNKGYRNFKLEFQSNLIQTISKFLSILLQRIHLYSNTEYKLKFKYFLLSYLTLILTHLQNLEP